MNWLARLKKTENTPTGEPTKPTKGAFVGFVAPVEGVFPENEASCGANQHSAASANLQTHRVSQDTTNPANLPLGRYAANSANLQSYQADPERSDQCANLRTGSGSQADELHAARVNLFTRRGLRLIDAERLAATIARRALELDDRRICLECRHLNGKHCARAAYAGAGRVVEAIVRLPQRCPAFEGAL